MLRGERWLAVCAGSTAVTSPEYYYFSYLSQRLVNKKVGGSPMKYDHGPPVTCDNTQTFKYLSSRIVLGSIQKSPVPARDFSIKEKFKYNIHNN